MDIHVDNNYFLGNNCLHSVSFRFETAMIAKNFVWRQLA